MTSTHFLSFSEVLIKILNHKSENENLNRQYLNCMITITATVGNKIQLYFNEFDVEDPGDCNMNLCDFLDI